MATKYEWSPWYLLGRDYFLIKPGDYVQLISAPQAFPGTHLTFEGVITHLIHMGGRKFHLRLDNKEHPLMYDAIKIRIRREVEEIEEKVLAEAEV